MTEPSLLARDVLSRYRRSISPTADARDALVQNVVRRADGGAAPGGGSTPASGVPWLVLVVSALVVAGGLAWMSGPQVGRVDAAFDRAPVIDVVVPVAATPSPIAVSAVAAPRAQESSPAVEPATERLARAKAPVRTRRADPATAVEDGDDDASLVDEEVRLLRAANVALRAGRDGEARAGFDLHAQRFPDGALVELREVGRALLACRAATPELAIATVDAFGVRFPGSPHLARLARECPTTGPR